MGYKALITLDLPKATEEQRKVFYEVLENEKWKKISSLTTAWIVSFDDTYKRNDAITCLEEDMKKAKTKSRIEKVEYAIQLSFENGKIGTC